MSVASSTAEPVQPRPKWIAFATGASAALSGWMFVHPFDVLKVRGQLAGESGAASGMGHLARSLMKAEGPLGFYAGISAAATRQLTYGTMRLGLYGTMRDSLFPDSEPQGVAKLGLGLCAGGVASFLSNPVEVSLVRMQADGRLPPAERRNYSNVLTALYRIGAEDGARAYLYGVVPNVSRAMLVNMLQVGGYDAAKSQYEALLGLGGVALHIASSLSAGFAYSVAA